MVVNEHCLDTTTKKLSTWTTGSKWKKMPQRRSRQNILECTLELPELFNPDKTTKHAVNAVMMNDMKSATVKKALDEESKKLSAIAREQIQNRRLQARSTDSRRNITRMVQHGAEKFGQWTFLRVF